MLHMKHMLLLGSISQWSCSCA